MILQEEITTVAEAVEANFIGGALFIILWALFGMLLLFLIIPSRRNSPSGKRIMAFMIGITMILIAVAIFSVWPEFQGLWMSDPAMALGGLFTAMILGGLLLPSIIGLILLIVGSIFFTRGGLVGAGS